MRNFLTRSTLLLSCVLIGASVLAKDFNTGEIVKVNTEKRELTISTQSDCCGGRMIELVFTLEDKTKIMLDGKHSTLAKLKPGDQVDVEYEDLDDVKTVSAHRDSAK